MLVLFVGICSSLAFSQCSNQGPRIDCGYLGIDEYECTQKGCCWSPSSDSAWCFWPSSTCAGYQAFVDSQDSSHVKAELRLKADCRVYSPSIKNLNLEVAALAKDTLHFKISAANRWSIPQNIVPVGTKQKVQDLDYRFLLEKNAFSLKVLSKHTNDTLFDTSVGSLVFEEQYMEISTNIPKGAHIYGLGETVHSFRRDSSFTRQTMWSRDAATPKDQNIYGVHPFYLEMRNGRAHGVFLRNSNGMDVLIQGDRITYKVIGGELDFYIFTGPTPKDVVRQYLEVIGKPHLIPYWALGFHQCRYGYKNLNEVKTVVQQFKDNRLPLETMWTDIDYMDHFKDFTLDPHNFAESDMKRFLQQLHEQNQRYVLIIDPAIKSESGYLPFEEGKRDGIFVKQPNGDVFIGKVWPGLTAFPDFHNPMTQTYWNRWIKDFLDHVDVDGLWIDMNEPANFCDGHCGGSFQDDDQLIFNSFDEFDVKSPPYRINNFGWEAPLHKNTISPDALHFNGTLHYNVHNLYGHMEAIATRKALLTVRPQKRPFVLSRSSFSGTGAHSGHWTGDNWSSWEHLYLSIPAMLNFQLFGIPLVGADICGFIGDVTEELCTRWMQLGAFYPFSRNHNSINQRPQEPYLFPSTLDSSRISLSIRYSLLPYYYTLFFEAHSEGTTVIRPLFFEYPKVEETYFFDRQFFVGSSVLISPVLEEGARSVKAWFGNGVWYDWYSHKSFEVSQAGGEWKNIDAPLTHIPVHIRGGNIIPVSAIDSPMLTKNVREGPINLLVALDSEGNASGSFFLDDGETDPSFSHDWLHGKPGYIHSLFTVTSVSYRKGGKLNVKLASVPTYHPLLTQVYSNVIVLGLSNPPSRGIFLNGKLVSQDQWLYQNGELIVKHLDVSVDKPFSLDWE